MPVHVDDGDLHPFPRHRYSYKERQRALCWQLTDLRFGTCRTDLGLLYTCLSFLLTGPETTHWW